MAPLLLFESVVVYDWSKFHSNPIKMHEGHNSFLKLAEFDMGFQCHIQIITANNPRLYISIFISLGP